MTYSNFETLETDDKELQPYFDFLKEHRANPKPVDYSQYPENERAHWRRVFENGNKHGLAELSSFTRIDKNTCKNIDGVIVGTRGTGMYLQCSRGEVSFYWEGGRVKNGYWACHVHIPTDPHWRQFGSKNANHNRALDKEELDEVCELIYDATLLHEVKTYFVQSAWNEASYRRPRKDAIV